MKRIILCLIAGLFVLTLSSCEFPGYKIKPGDKIGQMQFLDYCDAPNIHEICDWDLLLTGQCEIPASYDTFWISVGWQEKTQEELEKAWEGSQWKMTMDGRTVDLEEFGTYDLEAYGEAARVWNVCITNPPAGPHIVRYDYELAPGVAPSPITDILKFKVLDD